MATPHLVRNAGNGFSNTHLDCRVADDSTGAIGTSLRENHLTGSKRQEELHVRSSPLREKRDDRALEQPGSETCAENPLDEILLP